MSVEKRKSFLVEFCASIACQLLEACPQDICRDSVLLSELGLGKGWEDCPPERLQGILCVSKLYGKVCVCVCVCLSDCFLATEKMVCELPSEVLGY